MEKAEPTVPGEEAAFWERKAKNGRRAAGAICLSRHHPVELQVHVYDLDCCGCSSSLCLVSLDLPSHKTSVSASSSSLRQVKESETQPGNNYERRRNERNGERKDNRQPSEKGHLPHSLFRGATTGQQDFVFSRLEVPLATHKQPPSKVSRLDKSSIGGSCYHVENRG
jgi:hypothetical protein